MNAEHLVIATLLGASVFIWIMLLG